MAADNGQVSVCSTYISSFRHSRSWSTDAETWTSVYGLRGVVLQWVSSYLSGRTFQVVYGDNTTSSTVYIPCPVPQGSVLGPRLFILCMADPGDRVAEHGVSFHAFIADTQLYVHCRHDEVTSAVLWLENSTEEVSHCMSANRLKLNVDKTELLWAESRHGLALLGSAGPSLRLGTETVTHGEWSGPFVRRVSTFTWRWVCGYSGPRFCDVTRGLLQRHSRWGIQVHHRQASASYECRRSSTALGKSGYHQIFNIRIYQSKSQ